MAGLGGEVVCARASLRRPASGSRGWCHVLLRMRKALSHSIKQGIALPAAQGARNTARRRASTAAGCQGRNALLAVGCWVLSAVLHRLLGVVFSSTPSAASTCPPRGATPSSRHTYRKELEFGGDAATRARERDLVGHLELR